ncbi:MAG: LemA family protein [Paludibacteraceae bacterium]|nr:LemA family protein [Paludibacteraceae bacterium]MBR6018031.1 LemA family protein [Paludibacteraceae bacterium]
MKKGTWIAISIVAVLGMMGVWAVSRYNTFVTMQENVTNAWGQVENQYQRRADLVPNLVATVKGYASHEQSTFTAVVEARAKATGITIDPSHATEEQLAQFQASQGELSQALGRLMAIAESYPELQANESFRQLADQLEGTENRIAYARNVFNDCAKEYNAAIHRFPGNIIAGMFGFERKAYFEAEAGAEKAPRVEF